MKNIKSKVSIILLLVFLFTTSMTAFAAVQSYNATLPLVFHKTIHEGTRASDVNSWFISMSDSSVAASYTGWLDATISGSWEKATNNFTLYKKDSKNYIWGLFIPVSGASTRLRAEPSGYPGDSIVGTIDYK